MDDDDVDPPPMGDGWAPRSTATREEAGRTLPSRGTTPEGRRFGVTAVAVAFALGAALSQLGTQLVALFVGDPGGPGALRLTTPPPSPPPPAAVAGPQAARWLVDAKGRPAAFVPTGHVRLVNVWLEGCADCQPHFEAWERLVASERIPRDVSIANVGFTRATAAFTERHRVDQNLVLDADGSVLVRPLGISKFTTLVIGPDGRVCHQGHPADPGFDAALLAALARCGGAPPAVTPAPSASAASPFDAR